MTGPSPPPELEELQRLLDAAPDGVDVRVLCRVPHADGELPVYGVAFGSPVPDARAVGYFGGVHGLERIGARVVIAFLRALLQRLRWDEALHDLLSRVRLLFVPLVNPVGMVRGTRANGQGVDLMRNAPVEALDPVPFLVGGQRISPGLPWYRGRPGEPMQAESAALCTAVEEQLQGRPLALALDCHSGFGLRDRLWFPYAHRRAPIEHVAELHELHRIFTESHANHPYVFEPQSRQYLAHGDLWDHLYRRSLQRGGVFLPLTLEMGSWLWVKKNPRQLFSRAGIFNPHIEHREQRVLRRHMPLLEFAMHAAAGSSRWLPTGEARADAHRRALALWYSAAP